MVGLAVVFWKVFQRPKKIELQFIKDIKNNPNNVDDTDEQIKGVLYGKLRFWVLEWWRTEGSLEKK